MNIMTITTAVPVGTIAAEHPLATRVFARHGIDFCCGGGRALEAVCEEKGLEPASVLEEILSEISTTSGSPDRWSDAPLDHLIDHILHAYHKPLWEELPRLEEMARKVLDVHREKDPEGLAELVRIVVALHAELDQHMQKEEQILFPMVKRGQGIMAGGPISVMEYEHEAAGAALRRLRELTKDYEVPAEACNTWRALWHGLAALETELHEHIHLENNILFPRALDGR
jgi:regulator of cell morphogenesis and NO signaling